MANERLSEFRYLIRQWDEGMDRFSEIVECGTSLLPGGARGLAREFRTARGTVTRWMHGHSRPLPHVRRLVVDYLRQKLPVSE